MGVFHAGGAEGFCGVMPEMLERFTPSILTCTTSSTTSTLLTWLVKIIIRSNTGVHGRSADPGQDQSQGRGRDRSRGQGHGRNPGLLPE